jgi:RNA-directed DNA polymerase
LQENLENRFYEGKQMTATRGILYHFNLERGLKPSSTGAPSSNAESWQEIDWRHADAMVKRLQMRIAKATQEKRYGKVKALQWLLTHSYNAKVLAVKRVATNKGAKTPGVDGVKWITSKQKFDAISELDRKGYRAEPLRRIYIPKKNGKRRPLGIPTMKDRAMQALHLLALEPVAEITADTNSYGFRPKRSTQDAMEQCFCALSRKVSSEWVLEADIKSCFDQISHEWLLSNVVTDRKILQQWLKAGYLEKQQFFFTEEGTPQGGIISPTLANIALNGLEETVKSLFVKRQKVNVIRYADDFIITGATPVILEQVKSIVTTFLKERGLELSKEKTVITSIYKGFNFLGFNFQKHSNRALLIKPAKDNIKKLRATIRETTKRNVATPTADLIKQLNPKLRGWANYYCHVVSSRAFSAIDQEVFRSVWKWARHRHPKKSATWIKNQYFRQRGLRRWIFSTTVKCEQGKKRPLDIVLVNSTPIKRYVKVRGKATPYDAAYIGYFEQRQKRKQANSSGYWSNCVAPVCFN